MPTANDLLTPMRRERDFTVIHGRIAELAEARFDVIAPQSTLTLDPTATQANVMIHDPIVTDTGVVTGPLAGPFTRTAWRQTMGRLGIPLKYADRLAESSNHRHVELVAHSVNELTDTDDRLAMYRYLRTDDEGLMLRAVLSNSYRTIDGDTALLAVLQGLNEHDLGLGDCEVSGDVTPDRMRLRITVPAIQIAVPDLLGGYRMPFTVDPNRGVHDAPAAGEVPPVIFAGIEISNSDTGGGAFQVSPRAEILICRNGLTRNVNFRRAHFGERMDEGIIDWSDATIRNAMSLISSQVTDAVRQFCSVEFLQEMADEMRAAKGQQVESPAAAVEVVQQRFGFTDDEGASILDCFIRGGDTSVLGVGNAVTAAAQLADDGDRQAEMEAMFFDIVNSPGALVNA